MRIIVFVSLFFISFFSTVRAQTPDSLDEQEEYDTIVVEEDPVIITEPLVLTHVEVAKLYLSVYGSLFYASNTYKPCPCGEWDVYTTAYQDLVKPQLSYSVTGELTYAPKRLLAGIALEYTVFREKFEFTDSMAVSYVSNNRYSYLDIRLNGGYWLRRHKKNYSVIATVGGIYSRALQSSGQTVDYTGYYSFDFDRVTDVSSLSPLQENQWSVTAGLKFILFPGKRLKATLEPYYTKNLFNVVKDQYPYAQYRELYGIRLGVMYSL